VKATDGFGDILPYKTHISMYTVEKERFQRPVKAFDIQYQLLSQKYFANFAKLALYASIQQKVSNIYIVHTYIKC